MMSGMRITPSNCSTYLKSYEIHKGLINKVNDKENDLNQIHAIYVLPQCGNICHKNVHIQ